jgi:metal-dependent amidase/aminoacylase/carboxypeptidase family protein
MPTVAPELQGRMITWRHALHQHPETGFEEHTTAAYVTAILTELGFEVHRGAASYCRTTLELGGQRHGTGAAI